MLIYQRSRGSKLWGRFGKLASLEISLMKMHKLELKIYNFSLIKWPNRVLMPPNPQFWGNKDFGVADFRDENDFAYIQYLCRDVPWNVSTPKNHTPIQQRQDFKVPKLGGFRRLNNHTTKTDT
ncbi:MAG: hypothetical protein RLZZ203_2317 [Cyanobacteriota bacterium]|jgi:hypothetical protein